MNLVRFFLLLLSILTSCFAHAKQYQIAIVIDDIGYRATDAEVLSLPANITYSFLPHTPYGKKLALAAKERNSDILLHIPMEATNGKKMGPGGLHSSMNERSVRDSLQRSFDEIPFAIGINNHMGSLLTNKKEHMTWTMQYLKDNNRFFLDSRTVENSVAGSVAQQMGIPTLSRQVFLDNHLTPEYIGNQFNQLISIAKRKGKAIGIAHPHPESIKTLTRLIPVLKEHGIKLVPISKFIEYDTNNSIFISTTD